MSGKYNRGKRTSFCDSKMPKLSKADLHRMKNRLIQRRKQSNLKRFKAERQQHHEYVSLPNAA